LNLTRIKFKKTKVVEGDRRHNLANTTLPELPLRRWGV